MKKHSLADSKNYTRFIAERNKALELLLFKAQAKINDELRGAFLRALGAISLGYSSLEPTDLLTMQGRGIIKRIEHSIEDSFLSFSKKIAAHIIKLKRLSYALSLVGEANAIGLALNKTANYEHKPKQDFGRNAAGETLEARVYLSLSRVKRDLLNALETSSVLGEDLDAALERCKKALPAVRKVKRPKKQLTLTEAEDDSKALITRFETYELPLDDQTQLFSSGFIEDDIWEELVNEYTSSFIPNYTVDSEDFVSLRSPDAVIEDRFGIDIERETNHEFVTEVRNGQNEAANQNGITDFMWIAVVDDKTDECCLWRDKLSTSQIEAKLKTSHKDDECQTSVPPAHFNCRCDIAPLADDLPTEQSNKEDFDSWLMS